MDDRQLLSNIYHGLYSRCSALEKIAKRLRRDNKKHILDEVEKIADIMSDVDWLINRIDERNAE